VKNRFWLALATTALLLIQAQAIFAQQAAPAIQSAATGGIAGVLKDPSGAVIAGAHVELRSATGNFHQSQVSNYQGSFSFTALPAGSYQLAVSAPGFASRVVGPLVVLSGAELPANLSLKIAPAASTVQVEGQETGSIAASAFKVNPEGAAESHNMADLLAEVPGVSLHANGELASIPFLHGLGDERTKIVTDGMTISSACPNHMNPTLSYVAPAQASQVTVLAGITPVSLGGDSLGGTISVESPMPIFGERGQVREDGSFTGFYRSNGSNWGGSLREWIANKHFGLGYTGAFTTSEDYTDGAGNKITSTAAQSTDHVVTLAGQSGRNLFLATGSLHHIPFEGFVNAYMDLTHNNASSLNLRYRRTLNAGSLDARFYWQNTFHMMDFLPDKVSLSVAAGYGTPSMPMNTHGRDLGYSVRYESALATRHTLRLGNELHHFRLDDWWSPVAGAAPMMGPGTFLNINNGRRSRLGSYAELFSKWTPRWSTLLGVRNDTVWSNTDDVQGYCTAPYMGMACPYTTDAATFNAQNHAYTDVNFDLTALARYDANAHASFEFGYARKNRSPNLYERYAWSTDMMAASMIGWFGDGNMYIGNVALKPETGNVVSGTLQLHGLSPKPWELKLTAHVNSIQNYIDVNVMMPASMGMTPLLQFANHGARIFGSDLSGFQTLWRGDRIGTGKLSGTLAYVHGTRTDSDTPLYQMMPLNLRLAFDEEVKGLTAGIGSEVVDRKSRLDPNRLELATPGYTLFNVHAAYRSKYMQGGFRIDNLLNSLYELPLGGNNLDKYDYVTGMMTPVTGRGRSASLNLTATF